TRTMDAFIANARQPYAKQQPAPPAGDPITELMTPIFSKSRYQGARSEAGNALLTVALALRAFQLEHGTYPAQLSELVPAYLKRVPADPFGNGGPLNYRRTGKNYVLWSIGPDGVNNGGRPIDNKSPSGLPLTGPRRYWVQPDSQGDVVADINQ
ncbi:MAG: hypothetical protein M3347_10075, partial [Armatimonadota bacterium]|nr:hypothetical protein [Armatimonadota bacterium]